MFKQIFFRHYGWIAAASALSLGAAVFSLEIGGADQSGVLAGVFAGALSFCYFVQQQKLAETALFHQLFTAFNARYDAMNDRLTLLASQRELSADERSVIVDYFNLCAEEFLFYKQGYIPKNVWRSWCRGMAWYLKRHPFKDVWNEEAATDSFYGLTLDEIHAGAV